MWTLPPSSQICRMYSVALNGDLMLAINQTQWSSCLRTCVCVSFATSRDVSMHRSKSKDMAVTRRSCSGQNPAMARTKLTKSLLRRLFWRNYPGRTSVYPKLLCMYFVLRATGLTFGEVLQRAFFQANGTHTLHFLRGGIAHLHNRILL